MDVKQFSFDKILNHIDRIYEWIYKGISHPITYELDMTNLCNHRCPNCFGFFGTNKDFLTLEEAKNIIFQIKNFGGRGLTFTGGGEPLLNKATPSAVEYAKSIGLDVGFITNGSLITEQIAEVLVKNCVWIRVSLDAVDERTFKITHGLGKKEFNKVLENIKLLVNLKKKFNSEVTIGIGYLTFNNEEIISGIHKFAELGKNLGVDYVQYRPLLKSFNKEEFNYEMDKRIIKEILKSTKLSSQNFDVLYSKHKYENMVNGSVKRKYGKCYGHNFATVVAANSKMYVCCHMRGVEKYCIGDLKKNTLEEIWFSEQRRKVYENIDLNDCPLLCRGDSINDVLWNIKKEKKHKNFI